MKAQFVWMLLWALPAAAAVEGTVVNRTTGRPQPGVSVTLTTMGAGGMERAGSATTNAEGRFRIEAAPNAAHLIQAQYQGVTYNLQAPQNAPPQGLQLEIFDVRPRVSATDIEQHMILVETDGKDLVVNETIVVNNDSQTTWYDPNAGTLRVYIPPAVNPETDLRARVLAPGSVPVERTPKKTGAPGIWTMDVPVKPGQTRFDISYKLAASSPVVFEGKILHEPGPVRLVAPQGITVKGDGLKPLGTEPSTKAQIFGVPAAEFKVTLEGSGSLRAAAEPAAEQEEGGARIQTIAPPGYERQWKLVLVLTLGALLLGFAAMYLKESPPGGQGGSRKA